MSIKCTAVCHHVASPGPRGPRSPLYRRPDNRARSYQTFALTNPINHSQSTTIITRRETQNNKNIMRETWIKLSKRSIKKLFFWNKHIVYGAGAEWRSVCVPVPRRGIIKAHLITEMLHIRVSQLNRLIFMKQIRSSSRCWKVGWRVCRRFGKVKRWCFRMHSCNSNFRLSLSPCDN